MVDWFWFGVNKSSCKSITHEAHELHENILIGNNGDCIYSIIRFTCKNTSGHPGGAFFVAMSESLQAHLGQIEVPTPNSHVYRDECVFSFDSPVSISNCDMQFIIKTKWGVLLFIYSGIHLVCIIFLKNAKRNIRSEVIPIQAIIFLSSRKPQPGCTSA